MLVSGRFALGHALIHRHRFRGSAQEVVRLSVRAVPSIVVTPNADQVVNLEGDPALRAAYARAEMVVPDGMPVVWASRLLGTPLKERVTGSDLMPRLCGIAAQRGLKVFLLGGMPGVATRAAANLIKSLPSLRVTGTLCPPLGASSTTRTRTRRSCTPSGSSHADLVFVCLGSPKQEVWIDKHLSRFDKGVFLGVGAAIDFCAGTVQRAPQWMRRTGTRVAVPPVAGAAQAHRALHEGPVLLRAAVAR
jgi:N-acetylglucosaminyldiphosphoundecaprenol N-acetyl-beta-D-mannosaminyltransferase